MDEAKSKATADRVRHRQVQESLEALIRGLPRGAHLTAPEVYRQAKEKGLRVSLSSVYRTLNNLSLLGQVQTFGSEQGRRYEAAAGAQDHDHLICVKCGWTKEFEDKLIGGFGKTVAERKGYAYLHSRFDILGVCQPCRVKGDDRRIKESLLAIEKSLTACRGAGRELEQAMTQMQSGKLVRGREHMEAVLPLLQDACRELERCLDDTLAENEA